MISRREMIISGTGLVSSIAAVNTVLASGTSGPVIQDVALVEYGPIKTDLGTSKRKKIKLVNPPFVHAHRQRKTEPSQVVAFEMNIIEKEIEIDDDGTKVHVMTYDGSVPGPLNGCS